MTMRDDVLQPFAEEWEHRARLLQEAVDRLTADGHVAPRIERRNARNGSRYTLIRRDGVVARVEDETPDSRAVTVRFTPAEWEMITRVVLLQHGLAPITERNTP